MSTVSGYAVKTFDKILIATVSDTPRAAMVNWLVTVAQVMVLNVWSDEFIAMGFDRFAAKEACGSKVVRVTVTEEPAP